MTAFVSRSLVMKMIAHESEGWDRQGATATANAIRALIPSVTSMPEVTAERIWNLYIEEVRQWYGVEPKNFLGAAGKHRECFIKAIERALL